MKRIFFACLVLFTSTAFAQNYDYDRRQDDYPYDNRNPYDTRNPSYQDDYNRQQYPQQRYPNGYDPRNDPRDSRQGSRDRYDDCERCHSRGQCDHRQVGAYNFPLDPRNPYDVRNYRNGPPPAYYAQRPRVMVVPPPAYYRVPPGHLRRGGRWRSGCR